MPPLDIESILRMILGGQGILPMPSPPAALSPQLPSVPLAMPQPLMPALPFDPATLTAQMAMQAPSAPPPLLDVGQALARLGSQALSPPPPPQVDTSSLPQRPNVMAGALSLARSLQGLRPPVQDPFGLRQTAAQMATGLMGSLADMALAPTLQQMQQALMPPITDDVVYQLIMAIYPYVDSSWARTKARQLVQLAQALYPGDRQSQLSLIQTLISSDTFLVGASSQQDAGQQATQQPAPAPAAPVQEQAEGPTRPASAPEPPQSLRDRAKRDADAQRYLNVFNFYVKRGDFEELPRLLQWAWAQDDPAIRQWADALALWASQGR